MSHLLLTFYGDDFTGSTDALDQLTLAGIRTVLFIEPPTTRQLARFKNLQAVGVAGMTRSMTPRAMERELGPALRQLRALDPRHIHYKVCSTFDSSPHLGSIGRAIDVATRIFQTPFVPVLAAAPALGRYTVFGTQFARFGIGSAGAIHRLDRHPSISRHPVTPMTEADLTAHLSRQTRQRIALFDIQKVALPLRQAQAALQQLLDAQAKVILFDAIDATHLKRIGQMLDAQAAASQPLFSVGSSGIEAALAAQWNTTGAARRLNRPLKHAGPARQVLIGSGSCSPVTSGQIAWALKHGFSEVAIEPAKLADPRTSAAETKRAVRIATALLRTGRSVIVHTTRRGASRSVTSKLGQRSAAVLGTALGKVLCLTLRNAEVRRLCIAGGDTSSYAARALGIESMEMIAPLTPGAPLCRATAPGSPVDGAEIVFKGGQVGSEDYFQRVKRGR